MTTQRPPSRYNSITSLQRKNKIQVSINLLDASKHLLQFLREVNSNPSLYSGAHLMNAVRRYEKLWLPLAARGNGADLAPPLDIEWVWYLHTLHPLEYEEDMLKNIDRMLEHVVMSPEERERGRVESRERWKKLYPSEPFDVDNTINLPSQLNNYQTKLSCDFKSSASREQDFYYQVSLPHFFDDKFLSNALKRYKTFLVLSRGNVMSMVPCNDIDLLWHTHHAFAHIYKADIELSVGKLLTFEYSHPLVYKSLYALAYHETEEFWDTSGNILSTYGAMFRGIPPPLTFDSPFQTLYFKGMATHVHKMYVETLEIENLRKDRAYVIRINVNGENVLKETFDGPRLSLSASYSRTDPYELISGKRSLRRVALLELDTEKAHEVNIQLGYSCKLSCINSGSIAEKTIDYLECLDQAFDRYGTRITTNVALDMNQESERPQEIPLTLTTYISPPEIGIYTLKVRASSRFSPVDDPAQFLAYPNLVLNFSPRPEEERFFCQYADHKIYDHRQRETFTCRVIHGVADHDMNPVNLSCVEVRDIDGNTLATSHLVSNDILPSPHDIIDTSSTCYIDPDHNERAMLVRGRTDWGVLVGSWHERVRTMSLSKSLLRLHMNEESTENLNIRFFHFGGSMLWIKVDRQKCRYLFHDFSPSLRPQPVAEVDMQRGIIRVSPDVECIPEILAASFSIGVLFILCYPWPQDNAFTSMAEFTPPLVGQPQPVNDAVKTAGVNPADLALVVAAGYNCSTVPTTAYLNATYADNPEDESRLDASEVDSVVT